MFRNSMFILAVAASILTGCQTSKPVAYSPIDPKEFVSRLDAQNKSAAESALRLAEIKELQSKQETSLQAINGSLQEIRTLLAAESETSKAVQESIATFTSKQVQSADDLPDFVEEAFGWPDGVKVHVWVDDQPDSVRWREEVGSKLESIGVEVEYRSDESSPDAKRLNVAGPFPLMFLSREKKLLDRGRIRGFMSFDSMIDLAKSACGESTSTSKVSSYSTGRRTSTVDFDPNPTREELIEHLRSNPNHSGKSWQSQFDLESMTIEELHALHHDDHFSRVQVPAVSSQTFCENGVCYRVSQPVQYSQPVRFFQPVRVSSGRTVCSGGQCYRIDD